ncbi:MAG: site-specific integrase [Marinobacter adhaerens]|nr:site-specific integrase [Marinobacter adhaerens]
MREREVSDSTIRSYVYCLAKFLSFLDYQSIQNQGSGMHSSASCTERFINQYINKVLANTLNSVHSLNTHRSALVSYFNWLTYLEISPPMDLRIDRKTRQMMSYKDKKQNYIQYVSKSCRVDLLIACKTLSEKLMMRMGFEVGLRTSELMGLRVSDGNNVTKLFDKLDEEEIRHVQHFPYWLQGRFTKGGRSRWIYFSRALLNDMRRYYKTERLWLTKQTASQDDSFFLRTDHRYIGTGIGNKHGSNVFRIRARDAGLSPLLSYHDLRHTFATELFHSELSASNGRETRSESAALIVVAQRLGHAIGKNGYASPVTTKYIRMRLEMLQVECD